MIRVVHILPYMGVGGIEQMVLDLCKFRDKTKFEYIVAAPKDGVIADEIRDTGVPVYIGDENYIKAMELADMANLHWTDYDSQWIDFMQYFGKPYITTLHWASVLPELPIITICTSRHTYEIQKYKRRFVAIPNGVDLTRFSPRHRQPEEEVIITRICRMPKCALYFWSAIYKILKLYPQTKLWIVGNQPGYGESSERVRFLGIRRDIPEILTETDIFAYTPYPDVGSKDLVVMEASAMGVPCVVSDVFAVRESVEDGKNGFLVPYGDENAFIQKVGMLIEDKNLRISMGQVGINMARELFNVQFVAQRYETIYQAVLDSYKAYEDVSQREIKV